MLPVELHELPHRRRVGEAGVGDADLRVRVAHVDLVRGGEREDLGAGDGVVRAGEVERYVPHALVPAVDPVLLDVDRLAVLRLHVHGQRVGVRHEEVDPDGLHPADGDRAREDVGVVEGVDELVPDRVHRVVAGGKEEGRGRDRGHVAPEAGDEARIGQVVDPDPAERVEHLRAGDVEHVHLEDAHDDVAERYADVPGRGGQDDPTGVVALVGVRRDLRDRERDRAGPVMGDVRRGGRRGRDILPLGRGQRAVREEREVV